MLKTWMIDAGNSSKGQVGFTVYGIKAKTKKEALKIAQHDGAPEELHDRFEGADGRRYEVNVYFNVKALTLKNVFEDDTNDDEDTDVE